ncbi:MAG TPA: YbhN family protein [Actinomycetota bacterium]|nr:YbhN family protein [Actinomycetota bacterium]
MTRWLRIAASIALVAAIFIFALPKVADFSEVWLAMREMTWLELVTLTAIAVWNIVTYWFVMMSALPGSNVWQTMKVNQASTAVANTLPGGGAIGVGVTYGMFHAYGFSRARISLMVLVTGIWNNFVKLGMPVVALGLLALQGDASKSLMAAAVAGVVTLALAVGLFVGILVSEGAARRVGMWLEKAWRGILRVARKQNRGSVTEATLRFRTDAIELVKSRGVVLTVSTLISHLSLYAVLLLALRHVGVSENAATWIEVLAAFSFLRLVSALPLTPGGLGVVELGLTAALVATGAPRAESVAAVLVYRALTYLLPIPFGIVAYLKYRKGSAARQARLQALEVPPAPVQPRTP